MRLVILVVDDERNILELFAGLMRSRHEVLLEYDAEKALARLLSDEEIDVTFLDLMLGVGPSGLEILSRLQESAPARLERIVASTGAIGIPGVEEELERFRAPTTGKPIPIIEKPYGIPQIERLLRQFMVCTKPRGPSYEKRPSPPPELERLERPRSTPHAFPRQPHPSQPRLPDYDEKEVSEVTHLANEHDPIAVAIRDNRRDVADLRERMAKQEGHFEDNGPGKRGIVREINANVESINSSFKFVKTSIPIIAILLAGLVWLVAAMQPKPERVDYERIQRDMATTTATVTSPK